MNKFFVGQTVRYNPKAQNNLFPGTFDVVIEKYSSCGGEFYGRVVASKNTSMRVGESYPWLEKFFNAIAPQKANTFRARNGRYATKKTFTVYVREIHVVPVIIDAANQDEAMAMVREGNGDYQNDKAQHSDLCADEYFDIFGERDVKVN